MQGSERNNIDLDKLDLDTLMGVAEGLAGVKADGHLTLMRFTTGWKVMLDTPNINHAPAYAEVRGLQPFRTLKEALFNLLLDHQKKQD